MHAFAVPLSIQPILSSSSSYNGKHFVQCSGFFFEVWSYFFLLRKGEGSRQPEFETGVALYLLSLMLMDSDSHPPARHAVKLANPAFFLTEMGRVSSQISLASNCKNNWSGNRSGSDKKDIGSVPTIITVRQADSSLSYSITSLALALSFIRTRTSSLPYRTDILRTSNSIALLKQSCL